MLLNSASRAVSDSLEGLVRSRPHLACLTGYPDIKVVVDAQHPNLRMHDQANNCNHATATATATTTATATADCSPKIALLSGGGSGHEPSHAGTLGAG